MQRETVARSLLVATCLCVVCSVLVSSAAVILKPRQEANKKQQMKEQVLRVAGLYSDDVPLEKAFGRIETRIVDLQTGEFVDAATMNPETYDAREAAKDPKLSVEIDPSADVAGLKRREKYSTVYLVKSEASGNLDQVILPVRGKGLWSTMYGFLSLKPDFNTVKGITFYEHGETPGLGGEIENERWQKKWQDKVVRKDGKPQIVAFRGTVDPNMPGAEHMIDGLAGATITTRGVTNTVEYWLGDNGFGVFLDKQKQDQQAK